MIRNIIVFIIALFALSGSIISAVATIEDRDFQLRGYVDATRNANLPFRVAST